MEQTTLYYKSGSSDKVYQASITPQDGGFVVTFAYGRRGSTLQTGTKTPAPVPYERAKTIYDKLIAGKTAKGYTPGADGTPYQHTDRASQATGIPCQLLNPIDEIAARRCIDDDQWWLQEKYDGRRLLIRKEGNDITGINRQGLVTGIPDTLLHACHGIDGDFIVDGEAIGDELFVFDLLSINGRDLRPAPYLERYLVLCRTIFWTSTVLRKVDTACTREEKLELFESLRRDGREGAVFKRLTAPYTAGRPASGGDQRKFKFVETASFIVARANGKRSVALMLFNGDRIVPAGNVTIPPNHDIPEVGKVVECRYLYAFRESGAIYQPVYLGVRSDIPAEECVVGQLKFKSGEDGPAEEAA